MPAEGLPGHQEAPAPSSTRDLFRPTPQMSPTQKWRWRGWTALGYIVPTSIVVIPAGLGCALAVALHAWGMSLPNVIVFALFSAVLVLVLYSILVMKLLLPDSRRRTDRGYASCNAFTLPKRGYEQDLRLVKMASRSPGYAWQNGLVRYWIDGPDIVRGQLEDTVNRTVVEFDRIAGGPRNLPPMRVFCFERAEAFTRFTDCRPPWVYQHLPSARIVLCRDLPPYRPLAMQEGLSGICTLEMLLSIQEKAPFWLKEGLINHVVYRVCQDLRSPDSGLRIARALIKRGGLFLADDLISPRFEELWRISTQGQEEDVARQDDRAWQACGFAGFLCSHHLDKLRVYLAGPCALPDAPGAFADCFGVTADTAMKLWVDEVLAASPPPLVSAPDAVRSMVDNHVIPAICNTGLDVTERQLAIGSLGYWGWAWGAGVLVDAMEDPSPTIGSSALRALENISGERLGDSSRAWRKWLTSVPAEVRGHFPEKKCSG